MMKFLQARNTCRLLLLMMALCLAACSVKSEPPKAKPPVPVTVGTALRKTVPVQLRAIGNVEPYNTVSIKAQVNGQIARVHFREGQDVRKGDLLFTIDPRTFEASLRQAEATLAKDTAQAKYAQEQARRYGALLKDGIVTQDQYDQLRANAEAFEATIAADRAAADNARLQLGYCSIRSPIDGRTGNLMVQVGNLVKANDNPVLVIINQVTPVFVAFSVPEKELAGIKRKLAGGGLRVEAVTPGDSQVVESGAITFLDNTVDIASGTIRLKGTFANKERRLWPGQFVNVVLTLTTRPDATVVPSQAVQTGQQGQFVFVIKDGVSAEQRPVVTGPAFEGFTMIEKGVQPGETVVTDGQMRLFPGAKVEVKQGPGNEKQGPAKAVNSAETSQGKRQ